VTGGVGLCGTQSQWEKWSWWLAAGWDILTTHNFSATAIAHFRAELPLPLASGTMFMGPTGQKI
jgi:hypothetical protein